jgi:hypothetical protein
MQNPYGKLPVSTWFLLNDSLRKYLKKDFLGEPLLDQPYQTCIMHNPNGNLPVSTWFVLYGSMLTHGILLEWSKYRKKSSKERYFR